MKDSNDSKDKKENRKTKISNLFAQFKSRFTSEEDCVEEIYRYLIPEKGFNCNHCDSKITIKDYGARNVKCKSCTRNSWITADSFFCRTRRLFPWLLYIWMVDHGITLNSIELSKLSGLATSSSQHIIKKVSFVLKEVMKIKTNPKAHSSKFIQVISKRSRETPAREHPRAEIKGIIQNNKNTSFSKNRSAELNSLPDSRPEQSSGDLRKRKQKSDSKIIENVILEVLSDNPTHIDSICRLTNLPISDLIPSLTMMEFAGKLKNTGGDFYQLAEINDCSQKQSRSPVSKFSLKKTRSFIRKIFQGVSRKYLQFYLATYWYKEKIVEIDSSKNLLKLCVNHGDISHRKIYAYISPLFLRAIEVPKIPTSPYESPELC